VLQIIAGKLPAPPAQPPRQIADSSTSVTFGWEPTLDVGGAEILKNYNIYIDGVKEDSVSSTTLEYTFSQVTAGQRYHVSVSAESLIGEGALSNPLIIWAVNLPDATTLTLTDTSRSSCSVQWNPVTPPANTLITGYQVLIDDGLGGDFSVAYNGRTNPSLL